MGEYTTKSVGNSRLILHQGAEPVDLERLAECPTPERTDSWVPIPHHELVEQVKATMDRAGLRVTDEHYGLYRDGARFFGLLGLDIKGGDGAYQVMTGLRNSHDKSFPVGLVCGSRVFVCDNLGFSSEIEVTRRHTSRMVSDLPRLITTAVGRIAGSADVQEKRFEHYRGVGLSDSQVHDLLVQSVDTGAIGCTALPKVLKQWRTPDHPEFRERNAWSLWNGFTEVFKQYDSSRVPRRSIAVQGLMDLFTQFRPPSDEDRGREVLEAAAASSN